MEVMESMINSCSFFDRQSLVSYFMSEYHDQIYENFIAQYEYLIQRSAKRVASTSEEAEDLAQDVLIKLHSKLEQALMADNIEGWIVSVVKNQHIDNLRQATRRHKEEGGELIELALEVADERAYSPESAAEQSSFSRILEEAMSQISEKHAQILRLFYIEGMSHEQCAARLNQSVGTVKSRINRAKSALREAVSQINKDFSSLI